MLIDNFDKERTDTIIVNSLRYSHCYPKVPTAQLVIVSIKSDFNKNDSGIERDIYLIPHSYSVIYNLEGFMIPSTLKYQISFQNSMVQK